ncbi:EsaB/YukD family protein [Blastococcus sp. SYSU D00813]
MSVRTTRITLAGSRRRVDLALDATAAVGLLVPDALRVLDEPPGTAPDAFVLTLPDGRALDPQESLAAAEVRDGTTVLVSRRGEAVGAAIVHDLVEVVADDVGSRPGRWRPAARRWTATALLAAAALAAVLVLDDGEGTAPAAACAAVVALLGLVGRWPALRPLGTGLVLAGGVGLLATVPRLAGDLLLRAALAAAVVAVTGLLLALLHRVLRAALLGAGVLVALAGGWAGLTALGATDVEAGATAAAVALLVLGVLPQVAVQLSGLARLDDRVVDGAEVPPVQAAGVLDTAHRGLVTGGVAAAAVLAAGAATAARGPVWGVVLAGLLGVAVLLRARTFPLTASRLACLAAGGVVAGALLLRWLDEGAEPALVAGVLLLGAAVPAALALAVTPPGHVAARARVVADRVEQVVVVATVPVLVGLYGVYGRLLEVFG